MEDLYNEANSESFDIDDFLAKHEKTSERIKAIERNQSNRRIEERIYGVLEPEIICPHCGVKGEVWRKEDFKTTEETREKGLVGGIIGKKMVTEKSSTKLSCKNCGTNWNI